MTGQPDPRPSGAIDLSFAEDGLYRVLIRDLVVPWTVGIHKHEKEQAQPVRLNIDLVAREPADFAADDYNQVVCYERIVDGIRNLSANGHVKLVETLADQIAAMCLADERVERATVRVEKLHALAEAASVGIEITRARADVTPAAREAALKLATQS
ncbi:MAG: dihydroneopterin aldolase [Alphaproteobacteria bacterium]|nr:dihydroneopterin aldolase [Alphaproteobacteria bacterium]